jgi:8-oxo-dGTP pyrophosphatase MutT (NUDIX family)
LLVGRSRPDGDEPSLLLTQRSSELRNHAGQISFPGGKPDGSDADLIRTALREAEEEVGLIDGHAEVIGRLAPVPTPTGYLIHPFVALVDAPWTPEIRSPGEVARILTPSLATLAAPETYVDQGQREWEGRSYTMHAFAISDPPLWGATARMVYQLLTLMDVEPGK